MESTHIHIPLHEGQYYHVYNRGNDGITIFHEERNYSYFLKKYDEYLSDVLEMYAYCLLPNHFHLLVRVKDFPSFQNLESLKLPSSKERTAENIVSELFRRFLMSYSKAINTQQNRKGSLFQKNFRRVHVDNESYFTTVISYLHSQMRHHGFKTNDEDYPWSSYRRILMDRPSKLQKQYVLEWFGGKEAYIKFHRTNNSFHEIQKYIIEE
jgi:putative transposase